MQPTNEPQDSNLPAQDPAGGAPAGDPGQAGGGFSAPDPTPAPGAEQPEQPEAPGAPDAGVPGAGGPVVGGPDAGGGAGDAGGQAV